MSARHHILPLLLVLGLVAFGLAGLSIADMFLPRPYDGVVLKKSGQGGIVAAEVLTGTGAHRAGIRPGDEILGIARTALAEPSDAAEALNRHRIGDRVLYLVKRPGAGLKEMEVELGRRRLGDGTYFYVSALGFAFFFVGLFVLVRQPGLAASQVFYFMSCLFLLFLVCRLRPASYSGIDTAILGIGTAASLFLPAAFLHFFLIFPRPAWLRSLYEAGRWRPLSWLVLDAWGLLYLLPPAIFFVTTLVRGEEGSWLTGAPRVIWWLLAVFVSLGLLGLWANARRIPSSRERRGIGLVLLGAVFGLGPFAVSSLIFPSYQTSEDFFYFGVLPLTLVPITFTYAIVRFQLLDIKVILRRSLLYTITTALVTSLYAGGIAAFNALFRDSTLTQSGYFPVVLALAIVVLFDPVRRRVQEVIDQSFFAGRSRLEGAMVELGEAMTAQSDLQAVVRDLVERLPQILDLRFCALYLQDGERLERVAGPADLPEKLPSFPELRRYLSRKRGLHRLDQLGSLPLRSARIAELVEELAAAGVESLADLASGRRQIGLVLFSGRRGQAPLEPEEVDLLERLLDQASIALETGLLLEERTQQAELERELQIAASIQDRLLPGALRVPRGWAVAAQCRPARIVGGDFFAQLPTRDDDPLPGAVVYGDVAGKSVSGALMMMAAHEALHTLSMAMEGDDPSRLFDLANRRIYQLGKRNFVAMAYLRPEIDEGRLRYLVAGQPAPLHRRLDGTVEELPLGEHRLPVGALSSGVYRVMEARLQPGEVVLGYSDGVTDARSPDGEFFGEERLFDLLADTTETDPDALVRRIWRAVESYSGGGVLYDDVTLVAVARNVASSHDAALPHDADESGTSISP